MARETGPGDGHAAGAVVTGPDEAGLRRAWGWVAHLADGGTRPWAGWSGEAEPRGRYVPGAQQLELLRRLNATGRVPAGLAARVLASSAPGRGLPELALVGAGPPPPFGLPPVDPATLPPDELIRTATWLLAEDLAATPLEVPPSARPRPWRRRYRLAGDPWWCDPMRTGLTGLGRPPGGSRPTVLVLADSLPAMLGHAWALRCLGPGAPPWGDWLDEVLRPGRLPAGIDVAAVAAGWSRRVGADRVRLVLDPARVPGLVGAPRRTHRRLVDAVPPVPADGAELARRLVPVLGVLTPPDQRRRLLRQVLLPRVVALGGAPLGLPEGHARRVRRRAARLRDAVSRGDYAVLGDPGVLLSAGRAAPGRSPQGPAVLDLALGLLRDTASGRATAEARRDVPDRVEEET